MKMLSREKYIPITNQEYRKFVLMHADEYLKNGFVTNAGKYKCLLKSNLLEKTNYYRRVSTVHLHCTVIRMVK